jgi:hypothetical protein
MLAVCTGDAEMAIARSCPLSGGCPLEPPAPESICHSSIRPLSPVRIAIGALHSASCFGALRALAPTLCAPDSRGREQPCGAMCPRPHLCGIARHAPPHRRSPQLHHATSFLRPWEDAHQCRRSVRADFPMRASEASGRCAISCSVAFAVARGIPAVAAYDAMHAVSTGDDQSALRSTWSRYVTPWHIGTLRWRRDSYVPTSEQGPPCEHVDGGAFRRTLKARSETWRDSWARPWQNLTRGLA